MRTTIKCKETEKCFAKRNGYCILLDTPFAEDKACTFCKPVREVTKGKHYPFDPNYQNTFSGWRNHAC